MTRPALNMPVPTDLWFRDWPKFSASLTFSSMRRAQGAETSNQRAQAPLRNSHRRSADARMPDHDGYMTIEEAALYVGASDKTLRRAVAAKELPELRIGNIERGRLKFLRVDLDRYLKCHRSSDYKASSPQRSRQQPPTLSAEAQCLLGLSSTTKV